MMVAAVEWAISYRWREAVDHDTITVEVINVKGGAKIVLRGCVDPMCM